VGFFLVQFFPSQELAEQEGRQVLLWVLSKIGGEYKGVCLAFKSSGVGLIGV